MASQQQLENIIKEICDSFPIEESELKKLAIECGAKFKSVFASSAAKKYWEAKGQPMENLFITTPSHTKGYTLNDVKKALGEEVKEKTSSTWASKVAKKLASENSLSDNDFPIEIRSGKKKAKGKITLIDVKIKLGLEEENKIPFASKSAEAFAKDNGINEEVLKGIEGTGHNNRITIGDLRKLEEEDETVVESNSSQMNCKMKVESSSSEEELSDDDEPFNDFFE
jgi:pyruvate/2-oxoglutarate dehydrogenase complex dihydrolipoamide acyltransferase (E2) component